MSRLTERALRYQGYENRGLSLALKSNMAAVKRLTDELSKAKALLRRTLWDLRDSRRGNETRLHVEAFLTDAAPPATKPEGT